MVVSVKWTHRHTHTHSALASLGFQALAASHVFQITLASPPKSAHTWAKLRAIFGPSSIIVQASAYRSSLIISLRTIHLCLFTFVVLCPLRSLLLASARASLLVHRQKCKLGPRNPTSNARALNARRRKGGARRGTEANYDLMRSSKV